MFLDCFESSSLVFLFVKLFQFCCRWFNLSLIQLGCLDWFVFFRWLLGCFGWFWEFRLW